ncbi:hypothetical protein, partial [Vibrio sp. OPT18]|uniref:hypothetical protein n=1 Tax=Vibrio sp. OPT18 TaxID=2778641 RepID=UPI00187FA109
DRVVTTQTLDKPGLINFLQKYADDEIEKLKELIFGGNPSAALDTLFELAAAYENADDAIQTILNELSTKLTKEAFNSFVEEYNAFKLSVDESIGNLNKVDRYEYIKDVGDVRYSVYLIKRNGIVMANIGILLTSGAAVTSWLSDIIPLEFRPHFPITIAARAYKTKPGSPVELILASATIATHGGIALTPHQNTDP